jgi:hypothetical protein
VYYNCVKFHKNSISSLVGERGQRGRGKSVSLPMSLKFDGKSNWKAFYAKFSRSRDGGNMEYGGGESAG